MNFPVGRLWLVLLFCLGAARLPAQTAPAFLFAAEGAHKILQYDAAGRIVWECPAEMARDVWRLPNGNILFCQNRNYDGARHDNPSGVTELTPEKQVAFQFWTTGQVWSCQRLADGNTLVGAASQGQLLIVRPDGQIARRIPVRNAPGHSCMRNAREIAPGRFLVAEESAHTAREYDLEGRLLREIKLAFAPYSAVRLENGNTVICGEQSIIEVDRDDKIIWSLHGRDFPALGIRWFAGLQAMPNGHLFVSNAGGKVPFLEIAPGPKIAWQSPADFTAPLGHGIHLLDSPGPARK